MAQRLVWDLRSGVIGSIHSAVPDTIGTSSKMARLDRVIGR